MESAWREGGRGEYIRWRRGITQGGAWVEHVDREVKGQ